MLTLKIKWLRYEKEAKELPDLDATIRSHVVADETTIFVEADEIHSHGLIKSLSEMHAWEEGTYYDYSIKTIDLETSAETGIQESRLIQVNRENKPSVWYLASHAWVLGSSGQTLERLI